MLTPAINYNTLCLLLLNNITFPCSLVLLLLHNRKNNGTPAQQCLTKFNLLGTSIMLLLKLIFGVLAPARDMWKATGKKGKNFIKAKFWFERILVSMWSENSSQCAQLITWNGMKGQWV